MGDNVQTVTELYEAFGRGDIPAIIDKLRDDVEWERGASPNGVPWLEPGRGKDHVMAFFGAVAEHLDIKRFEPTGMAVGDGVVIAFIELDTLVTETGRSFSESPELHCWWFDEDGKVAAFRHFVDAPKQQAAFTG